MYVQKCTYRQPYKLVLLLQWPGCVGSLLNGLCVVAVPGKHSCKPFRGQMLQAHLPVGALCLEVCSVQQNKLQPQAAAVCQTS